MMELMLIQPSADYAEKIADYRAEFPADRPRLTYFIDRIPGLDCLEEYESVEEWLDYLQTMKGKVTWYMCVRPKDHKIVGFSCLRHKLEYDDDDIDFASHIGYSIRPSERRKGYAKEQLRLVLMEAKVLGLDKVRIVCRDSNEGSNRTIAACGGRFVDSLYGEESGITINRYDIDVN